jgi:hypothetical protein
VIPWEINLLQARFSRVILFRASPILHIPAGYHLSHCSEKE